MATKGVDKEDVRALVENSIELHRVLIDLAGSLKGFGEELSQVVSMLKEASKILAEEKTATEIARNEIVALNEKLDRLIDQDRTLARGILVMESLIREQSGKKDNIM